MAMRGIKVRPLHVMDAAAARAFQGGAARFPSAVPIALQMASLISVAGGLGMVNAGPSRLAQATTSLAIHTSPSVK